jgi:hypothetical protein
MMGAERVVAALLAFDFDQHATDHFGWNAFMYALYREQVPCVMLLLGLTAMGRQDEEIENAAIERAFWHFSQLGNIIHKGAGTSHEKRLSRVFQALATVPEFFTLINRVVSHYQTSSLRESLAFVRKHPYMLNTANKLALIRDHLLGTANSSGDYSIIQECVL